MAVYRDGILYTDNSTLSSFQTCPTKAMTTYGWNLVPVETSNAPAEAGTALHKAIEVHLAGGSLDEARQALHGAYYAFSLRIAHGDRLGFDNVMLVLESWIERNPLNELPYSIRDARFIEMPFDFPFGPGVRYVGKLDALVERSDGLVLYVLDTKSTGNPDYKFRQQFNIGSQMTGYVWAAQQMFNEPVAGIYINVVHVAVVPTSNSKCKTHKGFQYNECGYMHPKHELIGPKFRTPKELDAWERDAKALAQQWRQTYLRFRDDIDAIDELPQYGKWVYQACVLCDLHDFCRTGRNINSGVEFDVVEWQPGDLAERDW